MHSMSFLNLVFELSEYLKDDVGQEIDTSTMYLRLLKIHLPNELKNLSAQKKAKNLIKKEVKK